MKLTDPRRYALVSLSLVIVAFLALNIFSGAAIQNAQLDLTENKLYTLSDGTKKVLASLEEPITLRLFVSRDLLDVTPGLGTYSNRVVELLERYVTLANGKIRLQVIDPKPFSPEEDRAVGFGLNGVPLNEAGELGYFGIAGTNSTDDQDVIAFLQPDREQFLEYDLTRLVYNLAHPRKKVVGLISGLPIDADPLKEYKPWVVVEQIKQFFEVRDLGLDAETIDPGLDALMVVHPFGLSDETLYAIDQFVMRGGKTMVFVDPFAEEGSRSNQAMRLPPDTGSHLDKLFAAWGIEYDRDKALGDLGSAQRVSAGVGPDGKPIITDYVAWLSLTPERFKPDDVITANLQVVNLATPGFIDKAEDAEIRFEPLITSTEAAAAIDASKVRFQPQPAEILKAFESENKSFVIAARIGGRLKSAFPDGPPKGKDGEDEGATKAASAETSDDTAAASGEEGQRQPDAATGSDGRAGEPAASPDPAAGDGRTGAAARGHLAESSAPAHLLVVADTDILADNFWLRIQDFFGQKLVVPTANNADFVINALDNLTGSSALIDLRSRGHSTRPFELVEEIQRAAAVRYREREQSLVRKLEEVQQKLEDLQTRERGEESAILTAEQQDAIKDFRAEMVRIRRELREVRHKLREDIDRLDAWMKVVNIGAMPAFVGIGAIALAAVRRQRRGRRYASRSALT